MALRTADQIRLAVGAHGTRLEGPRRPDSTTCDAHPMSDALVPGGYGDLLAQITSEVRVARLRAARTVNSELLALYWRIGRLILIRQESEPWGSGVIKRLATDLSPGVPGHEGPVPHQPAVHAGLRRGVARHRPNFPTGPWEIAVGACRHHVGPG